MSFLKGLFPSSRGSRKSAEERGAYARGPETAVVKMSLEERMAFRRELLFENVRITLHHYHINAKSYRFKVMRTDKRGHCYVVMLDMPPAFMESPQGQHTRLTEIAATLTSNAQTQYELLVTGVYWRTDEALVGLSVDCEPTSIEKYNHVTAEQLAAYKAARQHNHIQLGNRSYSSSLAPLGDDTPSN